MNTPVDLSSFEAVKSYLYGLRNQGSKYGLERMRAFAEALGHPERRFPSIHVAGTNGKGSTCAMLESIYRHAGYRTGLFTSPHLVHLGERIQIDREIMTAEELAAEVRTLVPVAEALAAHDPSLHPTFFEFLTAMGFRRFAAASVDLAILETGLGGRLDSTNVVLPELCIITSIGLDHCEILGDTLEKIAAEKAGILKPSVPVVIGLMPEGPEAVIRARADALACPVLRVKDFLESEPASIPPLGLEGPHQRLNAAAAILAVRALAGRLPVSDEAIRQGLASVQWAGRWDRRALRDREVIFEASHNPEGAEVLDERLRRLTADLGYRPVVVAGVLGLQRAQSLLPVIARHAREIILVRPDQPKASSFEELRTCIPADFSGQIRTASVAQLFPAPGACTAGLPGETLVVTGSIYLIGEVMEALFHPNPAREGMLQG